MFSWRRKPVYVPRERSIPLPLNTGTNTPDLKNSSAAEPSPQSSVVPEFSRVTSKKSVDSLRRFVVHSEEESVSNTQWIMSFFKTEEKPPLRLEDEETKTVAPAIDASEPAKPTAPATPAKRRKTVHPTLVVPSFETVPWVSKGSKLASLIWSSSPTQLCRKTRATRVKRAVVIGVHGYFPTRVTRRILGEPTGTSLKFATEAAQRLKAFDKRIHVDQIALEGEGKIAVRIESLYAKLLEYKDLLNNADFVFFAVHSQGAVVTVSLIAKLLADGALSAKQSVSVLAMAGSWLGPMPGMDQRLLMKAITRIEHDSLLELFELQKPQSAVSLQLREDLDKVLAAGVKVVMVGSADDQLIPLYSALALGVEHPNLFRAVYIDGEDVIPHVVEPLLQLALRQLNAGRSDFGVIVEMSTSLAGALTSKGHSKLYSHNRVYDLAVRVALETTGAQNAHIETRDLNISHTNPYRLPWAVQALVSECRKYKELNGVVSELLDQFQAWKPETKAMKDMKWRLVGLESKL